MSQSSANVPRHLLFLTMLRALEVCFYLRHLIIIVICIIMHISSIVIMPYAMFTFHISGIARLEVYAHIQYCYYAMKSYIKNVTIEVDLNF